MAPLSAARRLVVAAVLGLLVVAGGASAAAAQTTTDYYEGAGASLQSEGPVYVSPAAAEELPMGARLRDSEVSALQQQADAADPAVFAAVLPLDARATDAPRLLYESNAHRPGVYLVVLSDGHYSAAASPGLSVSTTEAREAADDAWQAADRSLDAFLTQFVTNVDTAGADPGAATVDDPGAGVVEDSAEPSGGGFGFGLLPIILIGGAGFLLLRHLARRRDAARPPAATMRDLHRAVDEDVTSYGEELDRLDVDPRAPDVPEDSRADLQAALDDYEQAKTAAAAIRAPEDARAVTEALEDGRWRLARVVARRDGTEPPERRQPCFFDPRHGPSAGDAQWTPPGGSPREVPVCAACFTRLADGVEPEARTVPVGGSRRPYWDAGPAYGGWAGGYFGAAVPAFLLGTMLAPGGAWGYGEPGYYGDGGAGAGGGFDGGGGWGDGGGWGGGGGFDGGGGGFDGGGGFG